MFQNKVTCKKAVSKGWCKESRYHTLNKLSKIFKHKAKKNYMCVSCYVSKKIRVGRWFLMLCFVLFLLNFLKFYSSSSLILIRNTKDVFFTRSISKLGSDLGWFSTGKKYDSKSGKIKNKWLLLLHFAKVVKKGK